MVEAVCPTPNVAPVSGVGATNGAGVSDATLGGVGVVGNGKDTVIISATRGSSTRGMVGEWAVGGCGVTG